MDVRVQREHSSAVISTEVDDGDFEMQVQRRLRSAFDKVSQSHVPNSSTIHVKASGRVPDWIEPPNPLTRVGLRFLDIVCCCYTDFQSSFFS